MTVGELKNKLNEYSDNYPVYILMGCDVGESHSLYNKDYCVYIKDSDISDVV